MSSYHHNAHGRFGLKVKIFLRKYLQRGGAMYYLCSSKAASCISSLSMYCPGITFHISFQFSFPLSLRVGSLFIACKRTAYRMDMPCACGLFSC